MLLIERCAYEQFGAPDAKAISWREAEVMMGRRVYDRRWAFARANGQVVTYAEPMAYDPVPATVPLVSHDERVAQVPVRDAVMAALYANYLAA